MAPMGVRACRRYDAGCDVALHCSGAFDENARGRTRGARSRATRSRAVAAAIAELGQPQAFDADQALVLVRKLAGAEASRELNKRRDGMNATEDPMDDAPDERDHFSDWGAGGGVTATRPLARLWSSTLRASRTSRSLARARPHPKVDLAGISVLALAQQYLDFIAEAASCGEIARLPRHGGVACLPQVEAAAASGAGRRRRADRRRACPAPCLPPRRSMPCARSRRSS